VEVGGLTFSGEAANTKKQAEKNAAMLACLPAWLSSNVSFLIFFWGFLLVCCG
jgi:hypothetical protein